MRIVFAALPRPLFFEAMSEAGAKDRLLSYYELKDQPEDFVPKLVQSGVYFKEVPLIVDWKRSMYLKRRRQEIARRAKLEE